MAWDVFERVRLVGLSWVLMVVGVVLKNYSHTRVKQLKVVDF